MAALVICDSMSTLHADSEDHGKDSNQNVENRRTDLQVQDSSADRGFLDCTGHFWASDEKLEQQNVVSALKTSQTDIDTVLVRPLLFTSSQAMLI